MFWADKGFNGNSQVDNQMMDCSRPLIHSLLNPNTCASNSARKSSSLPPSRSCAKELWVDITRDAQLLGLLGAYVYKLQCLGAEVRRFYANTLSFQELFVELFIK